MPAKKRKVAKKGAVWHQSSAEATLAAKPYINGYSCGHGVHGDTKYNRCKAKREWKRGMDQEGASRGSLPFARGLRNNRFASPAESQQQRRSRERVPAPKRPALY